MDILRNVKLRNKIFFLAVFLLASFISMTIFYMIPTFEKTIESQAQDKLKNIVEVAFGTIKFYYEQYQKGTLSETDAQKQAMTEIKRMRYGIAGYLWINDYRPYMVMHPTKPEMDNTDLSNYQDPDGKTIFVEFTKIAKANQNGGVFDYKWPKPKADGTLTPDVPKMSYLMAFKPWQWVVGTGIYIDDLEEIKSLVKIRSWSILMFLTIVALIFIYLIVVPLDRSIKRLIAYFNKLSSYDFSQSLQLDQKDEIGLMAQYVNNMVKQTRDLLKEVSFVEKTINKSTSKVTDSSIQIANVSQQVSTMVAEVAKGADEQARSTETSSLKMKEIVNWINNIVRQIRESEILSNQAKEAIANGEESVRYQDLKMNDNRQAARNINKAVSDLVNKSKEIETIMGEVELIAEQTNLLSLNTAIEAAKVGEEGKEFIVIAQNTKKLSGQVKNSVVRIGSLIKEMKYSVQHVVEQMNKTESTVSEQEKASMDTVASFGNIFEVVTVIVGNIKSIADVLNNLVMNVQAAENNVENIASIAQQTAASAEEVAASSEEQTAFLQEISFFSKELSNVVDNLHNSLGKFTLDVD